MNLHFLFTGKHFSHIDLVFKIQLRNSCLMTRPMKILEKQKQPSFRTLSYSKKKKGKKASFKSAKHRSPRNVILQLSKKE